MITGDVDDFAPGVQANIGVETSLLPGEIAQLTVLDDRGASLGTVSRAVDDTGGALFDYVTLPSPRAVLRASARGVCGTASAEVAVDVPAAPSCVLRLLPAPEVDAFYAPFRVLSMRSDPDPVTPGYQTTVQVATAPGWSVEILRQAGREASLGAITAGDDGEVAMPVTLDDGWVGLRAICRGDGAMLESSAVTLLVDTTPPDCALVLPAPGATITWDDSQRAGVQFAVIGRSAADDVPGEPVTVTVRDGTGAAIDVSATTARADGSSSDEMTVVPAMVPMSVSVSLAMRDHAGNACTAVAGYQLVR